MRSYSLSTEDGYLKTFLEKTKSMTPDERAQYLEEDEVNQIYWLIRFIAMLCGGVL